LLNSEKDRAENVMTVDLTRNDLSCVRAASTVDVPSRARKLCVCASFGVRGHQTSSRRCRWDFDLLKACFPGASITGAPNL
jgi:anthranilate/para-aminobenzoate synthase component I